MIKRVLIGFLILVALVLAVGIFGSYAYESVGDERIPAVDVEIFGTSLKPVSCDWQAAVFKGLVYKELLSDNKGAEVDLGEISGAAAMLSVSEGYEAGYELYRDDVLSSSGKASDWNEGLYSEPGSYRLLINLEKQKEKYSDYGSFVFLVDFTTPVPEPDFVTGSTSLTQGEVFVMELLNVPDDIKPTAKTDLGLSVFTPKGNGEWFAAVPIGNTRAAGKYEVAVNAGKFDWTAEVSVKPYAFESQNLIIDTTNPNISEANSPEAYQQYREKIPPLFDTYDDKIYWSGTFMQPVQGRISTKFGSIRYTNGNWSNPRYHWGVDIAADKGTPVVAPGAGRVVFAEYLLNTGNTVVIEHGGGLKSYFFHMNALYVKEGDMVHKGDHIGDVGSTGYSTGPHLHFEMRIGNQAINPLMLCEASSSLYDLDDASEASPEN